MADKKKDKTTGEDAPQRVAKPATYEVLKPFRNAETKVMQEPGDEITVANEKRLQNLFDQGLLLNPDGENSDSGDGEGEKQPAE
ncbi:hypothetical protein [Adhaeribacter aquaticus]|uniref:hypothetical protein n=1 Tax=Adhaeribacter aquaticus TaxID=299567 RepID=UPI00041945EB|nr:hypothetical protein [Adhaeribacter aquaticus]